MVRALLALVASVLTLGLPTLTVKVISSPLARFPAKLDSEDVCRVRTCNSHVYYFTKHCMQLVGVSCCIIVFTSGIVASFSFAKT